MGLEQRRCRAMIRDVQYTGKLHVDGQEVGFRCKDLKWSVPVGKGTKARSASGKLKVTRGSKSGEFEVGENVERWVEKILHPPTRAMKLGLKAGQAFYMSGSEASLLEELTEAGLTRSRSAKSVDLVFVFLHSAGDLEKFERAYQAARVGAHFWLIWPKGIQEIRQADVIGCAKLLGMGPGKVLAFDQTRTAMRFSKKR